jgi:tripartite-type tricarboxylate transporter receptor subunit TctC
LTVQSGERWPELPDVATFRESGLAGFPTGFYFGLLAPAGTSKTVITQLNAAENARAERPEVRAAFAKLGLETRVLSAKEYAGALREEMRLWKMVVDEAGVHME